MRAILIPLLLIIAACGKKEEGQPAAPQPASAVPDAVGTALAVFAGTGRDRLCLNGTRSQAAFVTYAASGDSNCSARGRIEDANGRLSFVPEEDTSCRIPVEQEGGSKGFRFGPPTASCAYYCGPGASLEGKTFVRMDKPEPVTDIAGDPLC